jgi:hypothetical protein
MLPGYCVEVYAAALIAGAISRCMRLEIAASSVGCSSADEMRSTWSLKVWPGRLATKLVSAGELAFSHSR